MIREPAPASKPPISGIGILCIILGVLILIPAGSCAGLVFVIVFYEIGQGRAHTITIADTGPMFLFTLAPTAVGVALIWAGLKMRRSG